MTPGDAMSHGNDDPPTPNGVNGGDFGRKIRALEAEDITLRAYVDERVAEVRGDIATVREELGGKMDAVIAAHPIKRTFDILEKMASPGVGLLGMLGVLVVLLWLTGLDFDAAGYRIGPARANEDSDAAAGTTP